VGFPVHPHMLRHACGFKLANAVINRKTADALSITIPQVVYIFADEVIE
jgi:hypothetical protein